jgi:hypothetical protein
MMMLVQIIEDRSEEVFTIDSKMQNPVSYCPADCAWFTSIGGYIST